jgi:hypothetical protein
VTSKTKHGRQNRRALSPGRTVTAVPDGTFRMVAAANPGPALSVGAELDLVKAALLYGDKVTILSPVTTMLLRAEALQHFSFRRIADLLCQVAPVLLPPDQLTQFERVLPTIDQLLRPTLNGGISDWQREALHEFLRWGRDVLAEPVRDISARAGIDQLARARREGLVKIENADPGDEIDLLASCIVSAQLAQSGQRQDNPQASRVVETFVSKLSRHLSAGKGYLIFDEPIASLTEAAIREGLFTPAKGPQGRSAQAMAASGLIGRLPTFPDATVDEVIDIRRELAPSLTRFRGAMVTISKSFSSAPWESAFEDELQDAWIEIICPAIEAIEASVRDNHSLLSLSAGLTGTAKAAWPGLAILAAGIFGHADVLQALGGTGALAGAAPVLQALRDRRSTTNDIRMQPFYFLYKADQALR